MKKKEHDRLKGVVYEAYMAGQARGEKTEVILEKLGGKFHKHPRTLQNWIYDVKKQREATIRRLEGQIKIIAAGDFYVDEETGEPKQPEPSWHLSADETTLLA